MRKISANLVLPVSSAPLRNGMILLEDDGTIAEVVDTGGRLKEAAGLEHYEGAITPGLIIPWMRLENREVSEMDKLLHSYGVSGTGLIADISIVRDELLGLVSAARTSFHLVIELCPDPTGNKAVEPFDLFNRGIELATHAFNEYHLPCSLMNCSRVKNPDLAKYIREYTDTHENAIPAVDEEPWNGIPAVLPRHPRKGLTEILPYYTLEASGKIFLDNELGSLEAGKRPGLNLVKGLEGDELYIGGKTRLEVLA